MEKTPDLAARILESLEGMSARISLLEARVVHLHDLTTAFSRRQTVPLDDGFLGVRTPRGWVVLGQEEFHSALYLAGGLFGHEPGTSAVIRQWLAPGDLAVDVGAHVGLMMIPMAEAVGAEGFVFAFEPNPRSAEAARRTMVANGFAERCSITVAAVSHSVGAARFYRGINSMMGSLYELEEANEMAVLPTTMLDAALPAGRAFSLIKIDVEGAEADVLAGMNRVVNDSPNLGVIAEFGRSHLRRVKMSIEDWLGKFETLGLTAAYVIDEAGGGLSPVKAEELEEVVSVNILFTRPGNERLERLPKGGSLP